MGFFTNPTSYRLNAVLGNDVGPSIAASTFSLFSKRMVNDHESHPAIGHLILLVFEAVMEVVCVSLPGYIVARQGMFDADKQKFLANLNVALFTPCLSTKPSIVGGRCQLMECSFHKTCVAIDLRQAGRVGCYPSHLRCTDCSFILGLGWCFQRIWV